MEWNANAIMDICIGVFFLLFGAGLLYVLLRLARVLDRSANTMADVNSEVIPLLTRIETTLDRVNAELDQVEAITTSTAKMIKIAETTLTAIHGTIVAWIEEGRWLSFSGISGHLIQPFGDKEGELRALSGVAQKWCTSSAA